MKLSKDRHEVPFDYTPTILEEHQSEPIQAKGLVPIHAFDHLSHLLFLKRFFQNGSLFNIQPIKLKIIQPWSPTQRLRNKGLIEVDNMITNDSRIIGG
jgi:hypothetical protein